MTSTSSALRPFSVPASRAALRPVRGQGSEIFGEDGRRYLDAASGLWNVSLGWTQTILSQSLHDQADQLLYANMFDWSNEAADRLCDRLIGYLGPEFTNVYLSTTGSTAVETAVRVARMAHRIGGKASKQTIISVERGYHGGGLMSLSASGSTRGEMLWEEPLPGFTIIPGPPDEHASLAELEHQLKEKGDTVAAFLIEPILGSGGVVIPSHEYAGAVSRLCRKHDVLLINDEVATSGGRCGHMFVGAHLGYEPDIVASAKGLASGCFPVGATIFRGSVIDRFIKQQVPLVFGSTQDGNPIGCSAALATFDYIEGNNLMARAAALGEHLHAKLNELRGGALHSVRGMGLMLGLELRHTTGERTLFTDQEAAVVRRECMEQGLLIYHFDGGLSLFPPMTISEEDCDLVVEIIADVLSTQA